MRWLRSVGSIKLKVSFAGYRLLYRALLQKRPRISSILLTEATPYVSWTSVWTCFWRMLWTHDRIPKLINLGVDQLGSRSTWQSIGLLTYALVIPKKEVPLPFPCLLCPCACRQRDTATHFNTLQRTATHCNTLQHTATHCNTLQRTATHCNTL